MTRFFKLTGELYQHALSSSPKRSRVVRLFVFYDCDGD